jgi:hypothetical protein
VRLDPCHDLLAVAIAGDADDVRIGDPGQAVQEFLDLARAEVLGTADDHVLDAADDAEVAVGVHDSEIAGVHPSVRVDRQACRLGVVPVAEHDAIAAGALLAGVPRGTTAPVSGSTTLISTCGCMRPMVPTRFSSGSSGAVCVDTGDVSVMPQTIATSLMCMRERTC